MSVEYMKMCLDILSTELRKLCRDIMAMEAVVEMSRRETCSSAASRIASFLFA